MLPPDFAAVDIAVACYDVCMPMVWCRLLGRVVVALPMSAALLHSPSRPVPSPARTFSSIPRRALPRWPPTTTARSFRLQRLIDNEKSAKADRVKALIARAGVFERKEMYDSAISDYDAVLRLDPTLADIFNARGELWRRKGDRPKAVADFGAALKLNPDHPAARANHKSLAQELE